MCAGSGCWHAVSLPPPLSVSQLPQSDQPSLLGAHTVMSVPAPRAGVRMVSGSHCESQHTFSSQQFFTQGGLSQGRKAD